jgi:cell division GTPase FtsZ
LITSHADPEANILFGIGSDSKIEEGTIRITVIATGFDGSKRITASADEEGVEENSFRRIRGYALASTSYSIKAWAKDKLKARKAHARTENTTAQA